MRHSTASALRPFVLFAGCLFALLSFALETAAQVTGQDVQNAVTQALSVSSGIAAGIYILAGLLFVFFGYRLIHIVLFIVGFYIGSTLAYIVLINAEPASGYGSAREWIFFGVCIGVGIIFGFVFQCLYKVGIFGLGAFGGFALAMWILSFKAGGVIESQVGRILFIVALAIVGGLVAIFVEKPAIIVSTSVIGAVSAMVGLDVFIGTGIATIFISFITNPTRVAYTSISTNEYIMLAATAVLAIIGIISQFHLTRGRDDLHKNHRPMWRKL